MATCALISWRRNIGIHSTSRALAGKTTAPPLSDYPKGDKQWYKKKLTIYGTPGIDINNTVEARNHAAYVIAQHNTGIMS
jgi:hypothetical protein